MFFENKHSFKNDYLMVGTNVNENFNFQCHMHDSCEFVYVEEGLLKTRINNCDFDIKGGEGALIFPNQPHEYSTPEFSKCWFLIFSINYIPRIKDYIEQRGFLSPVIRVCDASLRDRLIEAKDNDIKISAIIYALAALYSEGLPAPQLGLEGSELVGRIVKYISDHYSEDITLKKMSADMGYSYRYMSGVINRFFDLSLPRVVNRYRVNYACELLSDTDKEIADIALHCGFGSIRNFNRSFKEQTGFSPREYRENGLGSGYHS